MTKVVDFDPSVEAKEAMLRSLRVEMRPDDAVINKKDIIWRKRNLIEITDLSMLNQCAALWHSLSSGERANWDTAAAYCALTGWELFLQDTSYRLLNNLLGIAAPNIHHQYKVMECVLNCTDEYFSIYQKHYSNYKLRELIPGQKKAYAWNEINEQVVGSLIVEFNYFSDLEELDIDYEFYAIIHCIGTKDGSLAQDFIFIDLDLKTAWKSFFQLFIPDLDTITFYQIIFSAYHVSGVVMFDNFNFEHDSQNWAFDFNCDSIRSDRYIFNNKYWPAWIVDYAYTYISFDSVYPTYEPEEE